MYTYICRYIHTCIYMYTYICICISVCLCVCPNIKTVSTHIHTQIYKIHKCILAFQLISILILF